MPEALFSLLARQPSGYQLSQTNVLRSRSWSCLSSGALCLRLQKDHTRSATLLKLKPAEDAAKLVLPPADSLSVNGPGKELAG